MVNETISLTKIRLNRVSKIIIIFSINLILKLIERLEKFKINISIDIKR
jgi:hypothetical protein